MPRKRLGIPRKALKVERLRYKVTIGAALAAITVACAVLHHAAAFGHDLIAENGTILAETKRFRNEMAICDVDEVDQIITDSGISPHTLTQLRGRGIEVTVVPI